MNVYEVIIGPWMRKLHIVAGDMIEAIENAKAVHTVKKPREGNEVHSARKLMEIDNR